MGDAGDYWRDVKEIRRMEKEKHGRDCEGCRTYFPKRNPSILFPGQTCRWCGHTDIREKKEG